ncbi:MAG: Flp family type IVb pilin [Nocardioidaceae bacterium]
MQQERRNDAGATAVEYGLMITLIAAVIIVSVQTLGGSTKDAFEAFCTQMAAAGYPC